ncbi:hypothetical protein Droror1_Dr00001355 [Drosera rotundifolia]
MTHLLLSPPTPSLSPFPTKLHPQITHFASTQTRTRNYRFGSIRCMASPRRVKMVEAQIMRVLNDMLENDKGLSDDMNSFTTFSDIEVSNDLQVVKVYVSFLSDSKREREIALADLKAKTKYVRGQLGRRIRLRLTPQIRFIEDEAMERASRVYEILDEIKRENEEEERRKRKKKKAGNEGEGENSDDITDEDEWEDDEQEDEEDDEEDGFPV